MEGKLLEIEILRRKNFSPEEWFYSHTAQILKIDNSTTNPNIITALMILADKMQEIRDILGKPIKITSAYRCPKLNAAVGSKSNSQHIQGLACDWTCRDFGTDLEVIKFLKEKKITVDQCLLENGWIHVSIKPQGNRNVWASLKGGNFKLIQI